MQVQAYLNFDGRCEEAIEYYRANIGAEVLTMMKFNEAPEPIDPAMLPPGAEAKVMHAAFRIGETTVMASDSHCKGHPEFKGMALSITGNDEAELTRIFDAIAVEGTVAAPLSKTFFSAAFGIVVDRFGVCWMIVANA